MRLRAVIGTFFALLLAFSVANGVSAQSPVVPSGKPFDFALRQAVVDMSPFLLSLNIAEQTDPNGAWVALTVQNSGPLPIVRVLTVQELAISALALMPPPMRPALAEAASSDTSIGIEHIVTPKDQAFRVTVPPGRRATLALHLKGLSSSYVPSLLAWNETAWLTHIRQVVLFLGVISGLLAAAAAFAAGVAVLSQRLYARWAAIFITAVLFAELSATGVFDESAISRLGGPYALFAFALALVLAAAIRLIDCVASFAVFLRRAHVWRDSVTLGIVVTGVAALLAVPVAGLLLRLAAFIAATGSTFYFVSCARAGIAAAKRLAPAAVIFGLVAVAGLANALGFFGVNLVASETMGGFSAAAALLVALAATVPVGKERERAQGDETSPNDDAKVEAVRDRTVWSRDHAAITASRQAVFDFHLKSGQLSLSAEAADILDWAPGPVELHRDEWRSRILADDRGVFDRAMETYQHDPGIAFRLEFRIRSVRGRTAWIELRATMMGNGSEAESCLGLIADVTARKIAEASGQRSHQTDILTRFGNRAALISEMQALDREFRHAALVVFDLDRFKHVNASLGRAAGDRLLTALAGRLEQGFAAERDAGRLAFFRIGGDMFAMLHTNAADLAHLGERVVEVTRMPFRFDEREIYLPLSVGVASGAHARDAENLLSQAELAMVEAKRQGGDRACLYSSALAKSKVDDSVALEADLRRAIERNEIELHYQPIVRLKDRSLAGFEALLRWRHPVRGLIEPDDFVPHAERSGLIVTLGRLALREAVGGLTRWQQQFPATPPLFVSVNVAWRQIAEKGFAQELEEMLSRASLAEGTMKLELTESAVMAKAKKAEAALKRLKAIGVGLAIDDFGTGHSSLAHLVRFPFDTVKIDKSFLAAPNAPAGEAVLSSIVALAHELHLAVVAEGVESETDLERLAAMGCEFGQGFVFGRALPLADVEGFIAACLAEA